MQAASFLESQRDSEEYGICDDEDDDADDDSDHHIHPEVK